LHLLLPFGGGALDDVVVRRSRAKVGRDDRTTVGISGGGGRSVDISLSGWSHVRVGRGLTATLGSWLWRYSRAAGVVRSFNYSFSVLVMRWQESGVLEW